VPVVVKTKPTVKSVVTVTKPVVNQNKATTTSAISTPVITTVVATPVAIFVQPTTTEVVVSAGANTSGSNLTAGQIAQEQASVTGTAITEQTTVVQQPVIASAPTPQEPNNPDISQAWWFVGSIDEPSFMATNTPTLTYYGNPPPEVQQLISLVLSGNCNTTIQDYSEITQIVISAVPLSSMATSGAFLDSQANPNDSFKVNYGIKIETTPALSQIVYDYVINTEHDIVGQTPSQYLSYMQNCLVNGINTRTNTIPNPIVAN
jgi:hypothetical protein